MASEFDERDGRGAMCFAVAIRTEKELHKSDCVVAAVLFLFPNTQKIVFRLRGTKAPFPARFFLFILWRRQRGHIHHAR